MSDRHTSDLAFTRRLLAEMRPMAWRIVALFLLGLLAAPITVLIPLPMKLAVDSVLGDQPLPAFLAGVIPAEVRADSGTLLLLVVAMLVVIGLTYQVHSLVTSLLWAATGGELVLRFRARLFQHVQRLSLAFHDLKGVADSLYRIQYDAQAVESFAISGVIPLFTAVVTAGAMLLVTARLDWQLALLALTICPVLAYLAKVYRPRLRERWKEVKQEESSALAVVEEVLSTMRVVKAFGRERHEDRRFVGAAGSSLRSYLRAVLTQGLFGLLLGATVIFGTAAVLWVGVNHVERGDLTLGNLVLVMLYLVMLFQPLETIALKAGELQGAFAGAERAYTLLDELPEVEEGPSAKPLGRATAEIVFEGVSFFYEDGARVLEDVSFLVPAGSKIGIAGETGSGKTTLVNLLPRFYDPSAGRILLDGMDLRDLRLEDLRRQFAIMPQDAVLFSTSIVENIAYGRPSASFEEIREAAREANADRFISSLSDGYDTRVGERGMRLSGGQRQLVALARAFLRDAPILILDEPTSAIDTETEQSLLEALARLMQDRTTFLISHRAAALEPCDLVFKLAAGRLEKR